MRRPAPLRDPDLPPHPAHAWIGAGFAIVVLGGLMLLEAMLA